MPRTEVIPEANPQEILAKLGHEGLPDRADNIRLLIPTSSEFYPELSWEYSGPNGNLIVARIPLSLNTASLLLQSDLPQLFVDQGMFRL